MAGTVAAAGMAPKQFNRTPRLNRDVKTWGDAGGLPQGKGALYICPVHRGDRNLKQERQLLYNSNGYLIAGG